MAGIRKPPQLRFDGRYYIANFYKPDGKRPTISFGPPVDRSVGEIYTAFGKWIELYHQFPHKVLAYRSPYDAVKNLVNPENITTVGQLLTQFLWWAQKNQDLDMGARTERVKKFLKIYEDWPIRDFGVDELQNVQLAMQQYIYKRGKKLIPYTRQGINHNLKHIRRIWNWGIGRGYVTQAQAKNLEELRQVSFGQAPENHKRLKVTQEEFQKVLENVNSVVADMLQLIWFTAMRPGEVCKMRPCDILCDDPECWLYIPGRDISPVGEHKTMRFGRTKVIPLTTKSQSVLQKRISDFNSKEYIFKPIDAINEMFEERAKKRQTPPHYGNSPGTNKKEHPMIRPGDKYTVSALRIACRRGCERAGVEPFKPYDLRRSTATGIRSVLDKEAAKLILGHTKTDTTDIYLLEEVHEAMKVAKLLEAKT